MATKDISNIGHKKFHEYVGMSASDIGALDRFLVEKANSSGDYRYLSMVELFQIFQNAGQTGGIYDGNTPTNIEVGGIPVGTDLAGLRW